MCNGTDLDKWAERRTTHVRPRQLESGEWVLEDAGFIGSDHNDPAKAIQAVADHINGRVGHAKETH